MAPKILDAQAQLTRENEILDSALSSIKKSGVADLTIDNLVKALPYSKGTIYRHFSCKEDMLLALCNRGMKTLVEMFSRAASFNGNTREKGLAIHFAYMLYAKLYPTQFLLVITAMSASIYEKASPKQQRAHLSQENQLFNHLIKVVKAAIDSKECKPPFPMTLEQVAFSCWSLGFGTNALLTKDTELRVKRFDLVIERELINTVNLIFDGMRWRPLSFEYSWKKTLSRLKKEIFHTEVSQLKTMNKSLAV